MVPHREADRLIQTGVFKRSRNPIYLADLLILAGLILRWDAVLALPLMPILLWVLERRFVIPEETACAASFGMISRATAKRHDDGCDPMQSGCRIAVDVVK